MAELPESFSQRLTRLFRSGPAIQRRIKGYDSNPKYGDNQLIRGTYGGKNLPFGFGRENSPFSVLGTYGILDRLARYSEFSLMEYTPEIATALDIYADEAVGGDDRGKCFHIYSNNQEIKRALDDVFYDVLNIEFNLKSWTRNLVKYGDFFLYNEVVPDQGVINVMPIQVSELEREEGFDPEDPYAVRFKWITRGNRYLENWQISHFRILSNDLFLPYGTSILETARKIWRQLTMLEDAMLTYRVVRSPERRVFYIDVGNVPPTDVESYMDAVKSTLRSNGNMDSRTGKEDLRYNAQSMLDDYFIPIRGGQSGTKIDTLSGGQHVSATEDVEYIQRKLFAALKVPKPYMNFDENLSAKASLAQMDIRFSRTIQSFQKIIIAELNKLAMIHLFTKGFDGPDLIDFELKLSNPSSVALQQKLELWSVKFDTAGTAKETKLVDEHWIQKNILELTNEEISSIEKGLRKDKLREKELDDLELVLPDEKSSPKTTDIFDPSMYDVPGANVPRTPPEEPIQQDPGARADLVLSKFRQYDSDGQAYVVDLDTNKTPIKATPFLTRHRRNRVRREGEGTGRQNTAMPDMNAMLSQKNKYTKDVFGQKTEGIDYADLKVRTLKDMNKQDQKYLIQIEPAVNNHMKAVLKNLKYYIEHHPKNKKLVINEAIDSLDFDDISVEKDGDELILEIANSKPTSKNNEIVIEKIKEKSLSDVFNEDE